MGSFLAITPEPFPVLITLVAVMLTTALTESQFLQASSTLAVPKTFTSKVSTGLSMRAAQGAVPPCENDLGFISVKNSLQPFRILISPISLSKSASSKEM